MYKITLWMKMTTTNYWVYMMDQMMMDSKGQAKRKLGHAKSRAIGSSSRDVNLRLPFAGGRVGDLKSKRKVETENLTPARSLFAMLPVFDKIFIGRKVISRGRRSSLIKMTGVKHSSSDCSKTLH